MPNEVMTSYRIICTEQHPVGAPHSHAHIVAVGTGDTASHWNRRWSLDEVLASMAIGNTFYTRGETSGRTAYVERYDCAPCNRTYIRSKPDAVQDNNLDNLSSCKW